MNQYIPVARPLLADVSKVTPYLEQVQASRIYTNNGQLVRNLEFRLAQLLSVSPEQVVVASSGTQALSSLISVMEPTIWEVPDWTFTATGLAVLQAGKDIKLNDVSPESWKISVENQNFEMGTVLVTPFGGLVSPETLPRDKKVIVDAAASLGNFENLSELSPNHAVMFSLHATKVFGCGEGGFVVCGSLDDANQIRKHINFGFSGRRVSEIASVNGKMSEIHAAYALAALDDHQLESKEWLQLHEQAQSVSQSLGLEPGPVKFDTVHPYWVLKFGSEEQLSRAEELLEESNIGSRRWWPTPLSEMPAFKETQFQVNPVSGTLSRQVLGLPCYRGMDRKDFDLVFKALSQLV